MQNEKTLLQQIHEKEEELERKILVVQKDADDELNKAKEQAVLNINSAEKRGKEESNNYEITQTAEIEKEANIIIKTGEEVICNIREVGERNLESATQFIIDSVIGK